MTLTRRGLLAGITASVPLIAAGQQVPGVRPYPRPTGFRGPGTPPDAGAILSESGLGNVSGFSLRNLDTGRIVEEHRPDNGLPPASVAKAVTTLYALRALGPEYRFRTVVAVTGHLQNGRLRGDLYLIGGGDPHLDTDGLADLARQVADAGIFGVDGRAYVVGAALPYHSQIDPDQPPHVGYNPSISGMNLNFNRVHFEWKRGKGDYTYKMTARSKGFDPAVRSMDMRIADRAAPVFDYRSAEGRDIWSVSRQALGKEGARWLPVRTPDLYAGEVFREVAKSYNLRLGDLRPADGYARDVRVVASVQSAPLERMLASMLRYSTNLTAEVVGLRASQVMGGMAGDIAQSASAMTRWAHSEYALSKAAFINHSGLSDQTRITANEMVQILDSAASGPLRSLMKTYDISDQKSPDPKVDSAKVAAKTGTLNFTRGLAGYLTGANGSRFAFSIFAADMDARARAGSAERPAGAKTWVGKARRQERALLRRWARLYAG